MEKGRRNKIIICVLGLCIIAAAAIYLVPGEPKIKTPGKVKNFQGKATVTSISLAWDKAKNASGYELAQLKTVWGKWISVSKKEYYQLKKTPEKYKFKKSGKDYYYKESADEYVPVITTKKRDYRVNKLKAGTEYKFKIRAVSKKAKGKFSGSLAVKTKSRKKPEKGNAATLITGPSLTLPQNSRAATATATAVNDKGGRYEYTFFLQNPEKHGYEAPFKKYPEYKEYLDLHGCSTCAFTTILRTTVDKFKDYTPDMVLEEVIRPVVGEDTFGNNFSKAVEKQMPLGLKGMSKVFDAYGVKYKYVYNYTQESAAEEIRSHLKTGNPVIFTAHKNGDSDVYTGDLHTMLMLGLDENGNVIVGDSVLGPASKWGSSHGLVKKGTTDDPNSGAVEKLVKYFDSPAVSADSVGSFYNGLNGYVGYILVYK